MLLESFSDIPSLKDLVENSKSYPENLKKKNLNENDKKKHADYMLWKPQKYFPIVFFFSESRQF